MTPNPTPTGPETTADQRELDAQYYRRILHRMIDRGDAMAEIVLQKAQNQAEAEAKPDAEPSLAASPDLTVQLDRIARMVRRCILLAQKVTEPVKEAATVGAEQRRVAARKLVIRRVEDAIYREAASDEVETLRAELFERIDTAAFEDDIATRPTDKVITEMQADMGLLGAAGRATWKRRTPRDVAELCAIAAAPDRRLGADLDRQMPPLKPHEGVTRCRGSP